MRRRFAGSRLSKLNGGMEYAKLIDALIANDAKRTLFLASLLEKLGLKVASVDTPHPRLSGLHLTSIDPSDVADLVDRLQEAITTEDGVSKIVDGNDTFILSEDKSSSSRFSTKKLLSALEDNHDAVADLNQVPTRLKFHTFSQPSDSETPSFSHKIFYTALLASRKISRLSPSQFGTFMLYGSIVTSTNTMLDKYTSHLPPIAPANLPRNQKLLSHLPSGLTFTATTQTDGRGRGSNVWISPPGSLIFSTLVRHSHTLNTTAPVVFIQYLVALATVRAIKTYAPSTFAIPVRLKWPNDIYALNPSTQSYTKIGGVLVNSSFSGHEFNLVVGVGINVSNAAPSLSLNALSETHFEPEKLLARILVVFEEMYLRFCLSGWVAFEDMYYKEWLHTGQVVTLEMEGGIKARILGVTREWGMLKVQELDGRKTWELMSDGNSFDFFKGLLKRKSG